MKLTFENQNSTYPIVLLPEIALETLIEDLSEIEIANELGITPPTKKKVNRPLSPINYKIIENKRNKVEAFGGPPGCIIAVLFGASLIASSFFVEFTLESFGYAILFLLAQITLVAIFGAFSTTEVVDRKRVMLSPEELEKEKNEYEIKMKEYYTAINEVEQNYNDEYKKYQKTISENASYIKSKLFHKHLQPSIGSSRGKISPKRGFVELLFLEELNKVLKGKIFIDMVPKANWANKQETYNPDFTFICDKTEIHIDIEIDEPYTLKEKQPIHFIGSDDDERNEFFLENNWCVIRFTEKQVVQQSQECINTIKSIHESLLDQKNYFHTELELEPRWSYEEAFILQSKGYREKYLRNKV